MRRSRLHVLVTLRADFTDRPLQYVDFGELLQKRTEFILPLSSDEMEAAIAQPCIAIGYDIGAWFDSGDYPRCGR